MQYIRFGWTSWGWKITQDWYDGPYWYIQWGWLFCVFNRQGLPHIFEK